MTEIRSFTAGIQDHGDLTLGSAAPSCEDPYVNKVVVLGAGISGLTSALLLRESGREVEIWAREVSPDTTSDVAGAAWYPYKASGDGFNQLGQVTRLALDDQRERFGSERTGIIRSEVVDLQREVTEDPSWASVADDFHHAMPHELPPGFQDGFAFQAPVIDMGHYLSFLRSSFIEAGGKVVVRSVTNLADVFRESPTVINCTGLGSRELIGDADIHAARGQVVKVRKQVSESERVLIDEGHGGVTYIIPRLNDIVLGGTFEEFNYDLSVDDSQTTDILRRTATLDPVLGRITEEDIIKVAVGLRPIRSSIKLDGEKPTPDTLLIHNIGHGGSGVTLSWGCAAAVARLLNEMSR